MSRQHPKNRRTPACSWRGFESWQHKVPTVLALMYSIDATSGTSTSVDVLRLGEIVGPINAGINPREWKCKVTAKLEKSSREIGVALVVVRGEQLFFTTVEWEDTK